MSKATETPEKDFSFKERGQIAFEAHWTKPRPFEWERMSQSIKNGWADIEAAVVKEYCHDKRI